MLLAKDYLEQKGITHEGMKQNGIVLKKGSWLQRLWLTKGCSVPKSTSGKVILLTKGCCL